MRGLQLVEMARPEVRPRAIECGRGGCLKGSGVFDDDDYTWQVMRSSMILKLSGADEGGAAGFDVVLGGEQVQQGLDAAGAGPDSLPGVSAGVSGFESVPGVFLPAFPFY